jgi:hypothetical protein
VNRPFGLRCENSVEPSFEIAELPQIRLQVLDLLRDRVATLQIYPGFSVSLHAVKRNQIPKKDLTRETASKPAATTFSKPVVAIACGGDIATLVSSGRDGSSFAIRDKAS